MLHRASVFGRNALQSVAEQALAAGADYAARRAATSIQRAYRNYTRSRATPIATGATLPTRRGAATPFRKRRTLTNRNPYKKKKYQKLKRLVGTTKNKNVYNKKFKSVRRHNTGPLQLQQRIQSGDSLPQMTFARLQWRGSCGLPFAVGYDPSPSATSINTRSFILNELNENGPCLGTVANFTHGPTYLPLWRSLYKEYLVLGSKFTVKINPLIQSKSIAAKGTSSTTINNIVPDGAQPGYWYARVTYVRNPGGADPKRIGSPIEPGSGSLNDLKTENLWSSLRDFLTDPTVTYKKDRTVVRNKLHQHHAGDLSTQTNGVLNTKSTTSFTTEIESSNKPVTLTLKFSAKKDFKDKNILRNFPFMEWDESLANNYRYSIRFGYIGFDTTGLIKYHIPVDRQVEKFCEIDISYFVALRDPMINPNNSTLPPASRMADLNQLIEDEEEYDDESDFADEIYEIDLLPDNTDQVSID